MTHGSSNLSHKRLSISSNQKYLLFLVIFGIFALFFVLEGRSLEHKDSVRFAEISREILEFNDWILLRLGGRIYPDKPALHFWLTALLYKIFGISPFVARIPEAVAGFCGFLITFFFARKILRNSETAFLAAVILLSAYGYFFWAKRTRIDIELAVFYSMSLIFFYYGVETPDRRHKIFWYAGFWGATGCAVMSKGPVALTNLAVVISYIIIVVRNPDHRKISPKLLAISSPIVALPILPWVIPLLKHPQFSAFKEAYDQTVIMHRGFSFFTYFYDFPIRLFPASPFFFLGLWGFLRFRKQLANRRGLGFLLLWIGVYVFILHLSSAKNARYLLPIYMPCSIVAAWAIMFYGEKFPEMFGKIMLWSDRIFLAVAFLGLAIPFCFAYYYNVSLLSPMPYVIGLGLALFLTRKFLPLKTAGLFLSFIMLLLSIDVADTVVDEQTSAYLKLSRALKNQGLASEEVIFYDCYTGYRARCAVSYYYNKVIECSNNFKELSKDPKIRGIVTTRETIAKEKSWKELKRRQRVIPMARDFLILLKPS
jgi:4-amino-4-deoxy-L-arabinose transferase-like glycosyltransferase